MNTIDVTVKPNGTIDVDIEHQADASCAALDETTRALATLLGISPETVEKRTKRPAIPNGIPSVDGQKIGGSS